MTQALTRPAVPKAKPNMAAFDLISLLMQSGDSREENSRRCIEVLRAERDHIPLSPNATIGGRDGGTGAIRIPDKLLFASLKGRIEAAVTDTTTAVGSLSESELSLAQLLKGEGEVVPFLDVVQSSGNVFQPKITSGPTVQTPVEGASWATPVPAMEVSLDRVAPLRLQARFDVSAEVLAGGPGASEALAEASYLAIQDTIESHIWSGTGADGQVSGLESQIVTANTVDFVPDGLLPDVTWTAVAALNTQKLRRRGRVWVATPAISEAVAADSAVEPRKTIHQIPVVDSHRPAEDGSTGRLWLLSGLDLRIVLIGGETELVLHRPFGEAIRQVSLLRLWNFINLKPASPFRVIKS